MTDNSKSDKMSQHWCARLGSGVVVMQSENGESRCLSSHLCGSDRAGCEKDHHAKSPENVTQTQA